MLDTILQLPHLVLYLIVMAVATAIAIVVVMAISYMDTCERRREQRRLDQASDHIAWFHKHNIDMPSRRYDDPK